MKKIIISMLWLISKPKFKKLNKEKPYLRIFLGVPRFQDKQITV
jgi:hypothetical protein